MGLWIGKAFLTSGTDGERVLMWWDRHLPLDTGQLVVNHLSAWEKGVRGVSEAAQNLGRQLVGQ